MCAEVLKSEEVAEEFSRAVSDDDGVWLGSALQTGCDIRGLADNSLLLSGTCSDQIADYDQASGNAGAIRVRICTPDISSGVPGEKCRSRHVQVCYGIPRRQILHCEDRYVSLT